MTRHIRALAGVLLLAFVAACEKSVVSTDTGGLLLSVSSGASTTAVDSWRVSISGPSGSQSRTGSPGGSVSFEGLAPGNYTVLLEGFEGSDLASRGQSNASVVAGSETRVSISPVAIPPELTVSASDPVAGEAGGDPGVVTISRSGPTSSALTIGLSVTGTATFGIDYTGVASTVVMAPGQRSLAITVNAILDAVEESTESVTIALNPGAGYSVGSPSSATITILDAPIVTVTASDPNASEAGLDPGAFTVTRTGAVTSSLSVTVSVSGSATSGTDYQPIGSSINIPSGQSSVVVPVAPLADLVTEGTESVTLTIANASAYAVGSSNTATVNITDSPPATVTVTAPDADASEFGSNTGTLRITRTGSTTSALNVTVSLSGTAVNGTDYQNISTTQTIAAGSSSVDVTVTPISDSNTEGIETVVMTIVSGAGYVPGAAPQNSATVNISDTPLPDVSVTAFDNDASEVATNTGTFRIARSGSTVSSLAVNVTLGGTATNGTDYQTISTTQTIPAGSSFFDVIVRPIADSNMEGVETVVLSIAAGTGYAPISPSSATVTISDAGPPVATITITPGVPFVLPQGQAVPLQATLRDASGNVLTGRTVAWSTTNGSITSAGVITTSAIDTAIVTATSEGRSATNGYRVFPGLQSGVGRIYSATEGAFNGWALYVPPGTAQLLITTAGTSGDPDLYIWSPGVVLDTTLVPCTGVSPTAFESCAVANPAEGVWVVGVLAYHTYANMTLTATVTPIGTSPPLPTVVVVSPDSIASEDPNNPGTFRIARIGSTASSLPVSVTLSGSAVNGTDYGTIQSSQVIPAGETYIDITVAALIDGLVEGNELVTMTVNSGSGYLVGTPASATVTINNVALAVPPPTMAAGLSHTCAVASTGPANCWGTNLNGQLGDASTIDKTGPVTVAGGQSYVNLTAGASHTCGLSSGGITYCWGLSTSGQLGDGSNTQRTSPAQVTGGRVFTMIAAGSNHTCGLVSNGVAYCWGHNSFGSLGDGTTTNRNAPTIVSFSLFYVTLVAGEYHTCGLSTTGLANCWGNNDNGQVGDGTTVNKTTQTLVSGARTFVKLAAGGRHTCGLTDQGAAFCWGSNEFGQLGDGTTVQKTVPTAVGGGRTFVTLVAGGGHTCGLTSAGSVYCWGLNGFGQLGDATTTTKTAPSLVSGGRLFAKIVTGATHTCGVTITGSAFCWGSNAGAQLGDGTRTNSNVPVAVSGSRTFLTLVLPDSPQDVQVRRKAARAISAPLIPGKR